MNYSSKTANLTSGRTSEVSSNDWEIDAPVKVSSREMNESDYVVESSRPEPQDEVMEQSYIGEMSASSNSKGKIRNIQLREVNRGYIVDIGCHTFAISTAEELTEKLTEYIKDPSGAEDKWFSGKLF